MCLKVNDIKNERALVDQMLKYLKKIGAYTIKTADKFTSGIPDLIICYQGRTIFVEVKTIKGVVSEIQKYTLSQIAKRDCEAYVVRSLETLKEIVENPETKEIYKRKYWHLIIIC